MKKLLAIILLLYITTVSAGDSDVAVIENQAGGKIVLTQQRCPATGAVGFRLAYTLGSNFQIYGCWKLRSSSKLVDVVWITPDGEVHRETYNSDDFELLKLT